MKSLVLILLLAVSTAQFAQPSGFINPIIPGGHPDPSICRVGDDFYIVNSTFEYFPGLPIHHSKDLVNWELIGYGLSREEQCMGTVNLVDVQQNGGIHAPTIRYYNGLFYIIVTNVYSPKEKGKPGIMVNFIITAKDPAGPWSDPHIIGGAPGIDPDIFFDDDGKVYFVGTHKPGQPNENGIGEIWVQELDLENWKLVGKRTSIWTGACGGCCVEGPHIYKRNGKYYLLIAEGGTVYHHAVMIAASDKITGPFESNPRNPILTSRHLSKKNWVHSTGHADLIELQDGRWYMVALGTRSDVGGRSNMGRETHLIPVSWETAIARWRQVSETKWEPLEFLWPVCAPETGKVERFTPLPFPDKPQYYNDAFADDFDAGKLNLEWNFRRVPQPGTYSLTARKGYFRLMLKPETFTLREQYSTMGIRQKESDFEYSAKMEFSPEKNGAEAGISIFQQDDNYINFTIEKANGMPRLKLTIKGRNEELKIANLETIKNYQGSIIFKLISRNSRYQYLYSLDGGQSFTSFAQTSDDKVVCFGYIGTNIGIYATSNGMPSQEYADFDWVRYTGNPRYGDKKDTKVASVYPADEKSHGGNPLFDMDEIRNESSLDVQVIEHWHKVEGEVPTRQKLITINVGELWPGQDYRIPVRMIVPAGSKAKGIHLTGGHGSKQIISDAKLKPFENDLIAGGVGLVYTVVQNPPPSSEQKELRDQMYNRFIKTLNPHYLKEYWAWPASIMRALTAAYAENEYFEKGKVAVSGGSKNGASPSVAIINDKRITAQHATISPIYDSPLRLCDPSAWDELKEENEIFPETVAFRKLFQGGTFGPVYNNAALEAGHSMEDIQQLALQLADYIFISRNLKKLEQRGVDLLFEPGTHDCVAYDVPWGGEHFPQIPIYLKANSGHGHGKNIHPEAEKDLANKSAFLLSHFFGDMEPMLEPPTVDYKVRKGKLKVNVSFKTGSKEESGRIWWMYNRHVDGSAKYLGELFPVNQWKDMKYNSKDGTWTAEIELLEDVSHIDFFSNHRKTLQRSSKFYPTYISSPYTRVRLN